MLYSENMCKKTTTLEYLLRRSTPAFIFAVNPFKRKTKIKINKLESLFFTWQTLTYDDTVFTSIPKVCDKCPDQTYSDTVRSDSSEGTKFTVLTVSADLTACKGKATCSKTQVTNTDLDWQRFPGPPPAFSRYI